MTSYKKLACFLSTILLFTLPLFGQYTTTYSKNGADVLNSTYSPSSYNCVSNNCWVELATDPMTQITVSEDGEVEAINGDGIRFRWSTSSYSWVEQSDGITWGAMHVGNFASNYYLGIASNGVPYRWTGSAWSRLGSSITCVDGAVNFAGTYYCIDGGANVWWWTGSSWTEIRSAGDGATITANNSGAMLITTTSTVYIWDGSSWTEGTYQGFTPSTTIGSIGWGDDNTIAIVGSAGNVNVSHDNGTTWTKPDLGGVSVSSIAHAGMNDTFMLSTGQHVYHLNTIIPQTNMSISGTCGSACGSGNPSLIVSYQSTGTGTQFTCPTPWVYWTIGVVDCGFDTNADTVLNTPIVSSVEPGCDSFAPGTQCRPSSQLSIAIYVSLGNANVFQSVENGGSVMVFLPLNQKYKITSSTSGPATPETILGWHVRTSATTWSYLWTGVSVTQWCIDGMHVPNIGTQFGSTQIFYQYTSQTTPSSMPGAYINGDVQGVEFYDGVNSYISGLPFANGLQNWKANGPAGRVYTWDNTTNAKRGTGGNPTQECAGDIVN